MANGNGKAPALPADDDHPSITVEEYEARLRPLQLKMRSISLAYRQQRLPAVIVIEGTDAAGKGGAIRRMTAELDPRHYDVWPIGAPTVEEARNHYLWRFWQRIPERGMLSIFDRSWYGRVLVERVDGLAPEERWRRAYKEINQFERSLVDDGCRLVKLYFQISAAEQKARLRERLDKPWKHWKLSSEDLRAFGQRAAYEQAATEMFSETHTKRAPWNVIAANTKKYARIKVLETVIAALEDGVDIVPPPLDARVQALGDEVLGPASR